MTDDILSGWLPVAGATDLAPRHVFHAEIHGQEMALWRADDGNVNVWENRCLHRGVRLSIGINDGRELKCQYHGWRYANRTAGCTYIPAHPADAPARTIVNRVYPMIEMAGLVWTRLDGMADAPGPHLPPALSGTPLVLRPIPVNAPAALVIAALRGYAFHPMGAEDAASMTLEAAGPQFVCLTSDAGGHAARLVLIVQPVNAARSVIRGLLQPTSDAPMPLLRHHNARLSALRDGCEAAAHAGPQVTIPAPAYDPVSPELAEMPAATPAASAGPLRVIVARKWPAAKGVMGFELRPLRGTLPTCQPGAHIDLTLPNGLTRQYSLINAPGETAHWIIGVKREEPSSGGSVCLHDDVREGDVLAVSAPRNNFPLRQDADMTLFIAGGIGITPLLAMAQTLQYRDRPFALHCFAASPAHLAFADRIGRLGDQAHRHLGLSPDQTAAALGNLLSGYAPGRHVYVCGPGPMLEITRDIAASNGWPDAAVHFEYFKNTTQIDLSSTFEISLARSALTLTVPPGRTILEVLRDNGVDVPSSCGQGACGTCAVTLLEGEALHQDVYLNGEDRRANRSLMTCVSRAKSARLVLDI